MKILLSIFILLFTFSGFGQVKRKTTNPKPLPKCEIKAEQLPLVRGLKLGTSAKDVMTLYPSAKFEEPEYNFFQDDLTARIDKSEINNENLSNGIESIRITLNENKVSAFDIYYDGKLSWASGKEFTQRISESLKIPIGFWVQYKKEVNRFYVFCADFSVSTDLIESKPYLSISEDISKSIERIDEKKKNFQP